MATKDPVQYLSNVTYCYKNSSKNRAERNVKLNKNNNKKEMQYEKKKNR